MQDQHAGDDHLQLPLKFHFRRNGKIYQFRERDRECLQDWSDLRSECKWFVLVAMQAINVICAEVMKMDVKQVTGKRIRNYHAGWGGAIIPLNRDYTIEIEQANYRHMEVYVQ